MKIKRKNLIASILLAICVCIGLCVFAIPTNNVVYAAGETKYELSETRHEVYIDWEDSISPSDLVDHGFASVDLIGVSRDPETDKYLIAAGDELSVLVKIDDRTGITLSRLYYTSKTDFSTETDIDLETKKFIMPAYDIMIHAEFNEPTRYTITQNPTTGGKFYVRKWAYEGFPFDIEISPDPGYKLKGLSFVYDSDSNRYTIPTKGNYADKFTMPKGDITMYAEFEKIPYTITIPEQVTVKRGEEILDNTSSVYIGDKLTFLFDTPEHFSTYIRVNNNKYFWDLSSATFIVEAQNVNIEYFSEQDMWQITWVESENYTILFDDEAGEPGSNGAWFWDGDNIVLSITPVQGYKITKVLANTQELTAENGKYSFSMLKCDVVISVELEKVYMMDWTDEDTHSFTIKKGEALAESPDWLEKGTELKITVTPIEGYRVTKILANDEVISTSNEATFIMQENNVDFTAEVEKIVYTVIIYEWFPDYEHTAKEEFVYVDEQTATVGDTVSILHRFNPKFYSCGDIFYCLLDDPRNFDKNTFNEAYENCYYSADVWDEIDIDFDTMPAGNIAVFFELYERNFQVNIPANVTVEVLERFGETLETPDILTNNEDWLNVYDKIRITANQTTTEHFITEVYWHNSTLHGATDGAYLGKECVGVFHELFASVVDKNLELDTSLPITFKTVDTQIEWQITFASGTGYTIEVKANGTPVETGSWHAENTVFDVSITADTGYTITQAKVNGENLTDTYTMTKADAVISVTAQKVNYTIGKSELNGTFALSHTSANYNDTITLSNIAPNNGWRLKNVYYVLDGTETHVAIENNQFAMPAGNVTVYAEFEKIPYSITIPNEVMVKREGTILTNSDKVYIDDVLTITYDSPAHFETIVKVNNTPIASGNTFTVETANVVITYESNQIEWQISWEESEDYTINVFKGDAIVSNGDWITNGVELTISITPNIPEAHEVTKVLINGNPVVLENGKFTTTKQNIAIAAVVEAKEIVIRNDGDHAIVVDERENIKNTTLVVVIIEETAEEHSNILQKIDKIKVETAEKTKKLKAYNVKLVKDGEVVALTTNAKVLLLLPEFYEENNTKLYRQTESGMIEQTYTIKTVGEKRYAMFNVSELGTFAFASFEEIVNDEAEKLDKETLIGIAVGVVMLAGIAVALTTFKMRKKKKK